MHWTRFVAGGAVASMFLLAGGGVVGSRVATAQDDPSIQSTASIGDTGTSSFIIDHATSTLRKGRQTFRFDTFGMKHSGAVR
jgi:hypothetical protein